jgi:hypothetical protein
MDLFANQIKGERDMSRVNLSIISIFIAVLWLSGQVFGCPNVMTIHADPNTTVNVGQTVTFTAECNGGPIQDYEWIFPGTAYCIEGQGTDEVSCKFSPSSSSPYTIQMRHKYNGTWYGPASKNITVNAVAGPWYVKTDGNDDNNGRSWSQAFATIQTAIDSAVNGQEIIVNGGTYYEQIDFKGKNLNVHGIKTFGDPNAIIDANKQGTAVVFRGNESYSQGCQLKDFIVRGEFPAGDSLALRLDFEADPNSDPNDNEPITDLDLLRDTSSKDRIAVAMNDVHWMKNGREDKENGAVLFDGIDDYVKVDSYSGIGGSHSRSVSVWFKTTSPIWQSGGSSPWYIRLCRNYDRKIDINLWLICYYMVTQLKRI